MTEPIEKAVGRKIIAIDLRPFDDGRGGVTYSPVFTLSNGRKMWFSVVETETGQYGVHPYLTERS